MFSVTTTATRNDDGPEAAIRAAALWTAYKRNVSAPADRLQDAPSQILAGFGAWRRMPTPREVGTAMLFTLALLAAAPAAAQDILPFTVPVTPTASPDPARELRTAERTYIALQAADILTTYVIVHRQGGREVNPLMRPLVERGPATHLIGSTLLKGGITVGTIAGYRWLARQPVAKGGGPKRAKALWALTIFIQSAVVTRNGLVVVTSWK